MTALGRNFRFAVCVDNDGYPASLELHKICRVLPDEGAGSDAGLRVIDESGEDYLYPAERFVLLELPQAVEKSLLQHAQRNNLPVNFQPIRSAFRI